MSGAAINATLRLGLPIPIQRAVFQGVRHGSLHAGATRQAGVVVHQCAFFNLLTGEQHKQVVVLLLQLAVPGSLAKGRRRAERVCNRKLSLGEIESGWACAALCRPPHLLAELRLKLRYCQWRLLH